MKKLIIAALVFTPFLASAQDLGNLTRLVGAIGGIVTMALPIVMGIALLVFIWGLVKFIWGGADVKAEGKNLMIWGIVALFIMVAIWGIVNFLAEAVGVTPSATPRVVPRI